MSCRPHLHPSRESDDSHAAHLSLFCLFLCVEMKSLTRTARNCTAVGLCGSCNKLILVGRLMHVYLNEKNKHMTLISFNLE